MTSLVFLAIFDLPTYLVLLYNVPFWGLSWTTLPTLIWDVINERSLTQMNSSITHIYLQVWALFALLLGYYAQNCSKKMMLAPSSIFLISSETTPLSK